MFRVYFVANYKPRLSHFWANVFLTIITIINIIIIITLKVPKTCDPILVTLSNMLKILE